MHAIHRPTVTSQASHTQHVRQVDSTSYRCNWHCREIYTMCATPCILHCLSACRSEYSSSDSNEEPVGVWDQALQPTGKPNPPWVAQGAAAALSRLRTRPLPQPTASSLVVESCFLEPATVQLCCKCQVTTSAPHSLPTATCLLHRLQGPGLYNRLRPGAAQGQGAGTWHVHPQRQVSDIGAGSDADAIGGLEC
jgi:hypothetical protein